MSNLKVHTVQSVAASAVLYPVVGENAIPFGLAAVLIDLDHVIEYVRNTRSLDIRGVFPCCRIIEKNLDKNFLVFNLFHTLEFFALVALSATIFPVLWYVFAGMIFHIMADMFHLIRIGWPFVRVYSIVEYIYRRRNGEYVTSVKELLRKDDLDTSGIRNLQGWVKKWK
jgi:hypothetical protein